MWLHPLMGTTTVDGPAPQAYMVALRHVVLTLDGDPAWRRWWHTSGIPECELGIVAEEPHEHLRPSADIHQVPDKVRANFTCAAPVATRRPADLFPQAVREVTGMFEVIREAIGLGALPPVPDLPDLPEQARELEVTCKALPTEEQGSLAKIQEFFDDFGETAPTG